MPENRLKKLQSESASWKQLLKLMEEEVARFRNRFSEIMKARFDKNLLEETDAFKNRFFQQEEMIRLLRRDIGELDKLLTGRTFEPQNTTVEMQVKLGDLRRKMAVAESRFFKIRTGFNKFLLENIL